jgi:hypothetical protein
MSPKILQKIEQQDLKKRIFLIIFILIIPAVVLEIWSVNRLATLGSKINTLEQTKAALTLENQVLENQIAQKSSLAEIEDSSKQLGFQKIKSVTYLGPDNLALKQ